MTIDILITVLVSKKLTITSDVGDKLSVGICFKLHSVNIHVISFPDIIRVTQGDLR